MLRDFNANVRKKSIEMKAALGNFGVDTWNNIGDILIAFAVRNNLKVTNIFLNTRQVRSEHGKAQTVKSTIKSTSFLQTDWTE